MDEKSGNVRSLHHQANSDADSPHVDWFADQELTKHILSVSNDNPAHWVGLAFSANKFQNEYSHDPQDLEALFARIESVLMKVLHGQKIDVAIAALDLFRTELLDLMTRTYLWGAGNATVGVSVVDLPSDAKDADRPQEPNE